jgi:hypothetical protein
MVSGQVRGPVAMVRQDQRQFDAALASPRADLHPARWRTLISGSGNRRTHFVTRKPKAARARWHRRNHRLARASSVAVLAAVRASIPLLRRNSRTTAAGPRAYTAGLSISRLADQTDDPLRLAERIDSDQMRRARETAADAIVIRRADLIARGSGWRKTGRPKVASVMKTSQVHRLEGRAGGIGVSACSPPKRRCACHAASRPRSAPSPAHGRRDGTAPSRRRCRSARRGLSGLPVARADPRHHSGSP